MSPEYPQKPLRPEIVHHSKLPSEATVLARIDDTLNYNNRFILLLKWNETLIWLTVSDRTPHYTIDQFEAPMELIPWFSAALTDFCKSPAEGGLHAGAMTSDDQEVGGEMLCLQRAMSAARDKEGEEHGGYCVLNRSRPNRLSQNLGHYRASEIMLADNLLFDGGLLDLINELADKYRKGLI